MKVIIPLLILFLSILFFGCSKPETVVNGEAFVVTAGAGTYKLGGVQITAVPEKDVVLKVSAGGPQLATQIKNYHDKESSCKTMTNNLHAMSMDQLEALPKKIEGCYSDLEDDLSSLLLIVSGSSGVASSATNSDGKYSIKVPGSLPFYLVARAQRLAGTKTEKYAWLIKVDPAASPKEVMLTGENVVDISAFENLLTTVPAK